MQSPSPPRVFVSSVVEGFRAYREAAREAIGELGAQSILVNEDFPSLATSPRNACLDAVDSSDIFVLIVGERGGWVAPSGRLVVEEEYDQAQVQKLPVVVFVKEGERDEDAGRLTAKVSEFVDGSLRRTFGSPETLAHEVRRALRPLVEALRLPVTSPASLNAALLEPVQRGGDPILRVVIVPQRDEELVDPVKVNVDELARTVYELAHDRDVELLDYTVGKNHRMKGGVLDIEQGASGRREGPYVRLRLSERGHLTCDVEFGGGSRRAALDQFLDPIVVSKDDIERAGYAILAFYARFVQRFDPYLRHQSFLWNASIHNIGHRSIVDDARPSASYTVNIWGSDDPIVAYDTARTIGRHDLEEPTEEVARLTVYLKRRTEDR